MINYITCSNKFSLNTLKILKRQEYYIKENNNIKIIKSSYNLIVSQNYLYKEQLLILKHQNQTKMN